ncbi:DUF1559 family PulG-like putative transporter [Aeoliella mucimassa]|uniref:DUF1559 domain-containing protein n=1 Tax=Aeoliella mucimassa TaxID=2527972 RepID=A0A518ASY0_9BACT|nr:DUF1559 domain-containing protein [Aeoliella mucimassa]QDU57806.1 hypothetical protein Pan181_40290 [Aeoliella mucimassa]
MSPHLPEEDNPYRSTDDAHPQPASLKTKFIRTGLLIAVLMLIVVPLLMPAVRSARPAAYRNQCINNVKQLNLAILGYESKHGELPPAYSVDEQGNPLHSWRTLILPYLAGETVSEKIDLTKPWDHETNAIARRTTLYEYKCPMDAVDDNYTSYVAVTGAECVFNGSTPCKLSEITDGSSSTLLLVELTGSQIEWMEPRDITLKELLAITEESEANHHGVFIVGYVDGHSELIEVDIDHEVLRAMATKAGGEKLGE